jgi:serine/threonine-protein kinase
MVRFLRFAVEKSLAGEGDSLKEYLLGVEVFDRPESFDPKTDTIVRVEARRLRRKLKEYYDGEGSTDGVRIDIPSPGYVPSFSADSAPQAAESPAEHPPVKRPTWIAIAAGVALVLGASAWWIAQSRHFAGDIQSIAVLPFADMSAAKDQEYFCDGFTEELISELASAEDLRVVARTSAFAFKNKSGDIREIGKTLNADSILEGSVRRNGDMLRITAQLIRASDGYHLWSKSYDRKPEDVLAVQQEIAELIASTLRKQLAPASKAASRTPNLEAHDLYLLGRYHWNRLDEGDLEKAVGYFEKAIALEPDSAQNYSGLADAYSYMTDLEFKPTSEILPKARAAADRALELNPLSAEAHTARGIIAHELEWDQTRARQELLRAIELKPNYAYGVHWYAHYLEFQGNMEEAESQMRRAMLIDPLSHMFSVDLAMIHYKRRHYDEALQELQHADELEPGYFLQDASRAMIYLAQGKRAEALKIARAYHDKMQDDPLAIGMLGVAAAQSGDLEVARKSLTDLLKVSSRTYVPDYLPALVYYAVNDPARGRAALQKSVERHSALLLWIKRTPLFDQIAADPLGKMLLDRAGF